MNLYKLEDAFCEKVEAMGAELYGLNTVTINKIPYYSLKAFKNNETILETQIEITNSEEMNYVNGMLSSEPCVHCK